MIKLHGICIFVYFCHPIPLEQHVVVMGMRPKSGANGPKELLYVEGKHG